MATANPFTPTDDRAPATGGVDALGELAVRAGHPLTTALQATAFWAAVLLPFVALVLVFGPGVDPATLSGVLAANGLALVGGHGHHA